MRYFSTFTGIGGFELGIIKAHGNSRNNQEQEADGAGVPLDRDSTLPEHSTRRSESPECVGYSEIDKYATAIYQKHFPEHNNYGDITKINADALPDFDLLVGGFPCQAFSIAGKRKGFDDTRGTLFFDVARIAKAKEPLFLLLENVKGLASHDGGKTLEVILATLQELGYYTNYEIRNSKDYGVPQNRERIIFLCRSIKLLASVGQSEKITTSENIIQEWLFQLLLNDLGEVKKLQEHASKDWVVGWLLCHAISQNPEWSAENILDGISIATEEKSSPLRGDPWQNIAIWLNKNLGADSDELSMSTISTAIKQTIDSKTYTYSSMLMSILQATVLLRGLSSHLWSEVLSSLILLQEDTKYARINNKNEEAIVTESGVAHLSSELQAHGDFFIVGHLRGTPRPKVFPFGEATGAINAGPEQRDTEVASTLRSRYGNGTDSHIKVREATKQGYAVAHVGDSINYGIPNSKTRRGRVGGGIAQTLDTGMQQATLTPDMQIRRLTPTECERLQGFPDGWTEGISDTQRYKTLGNAVTVNVIADVMGRII